MIFFDPSEVVHRADVRCSTQAARDFEASDLDSCIHALALPYARR